MSEQKEYLVEVDKQKRWTSGVYRSVTKEELDEIIDEYGKKVLQIVGNGEKGAMAMLACFENSIGNNGYKELINAYDLLAGDSKSLSEREHELRNLWKQYKDLWYIRYFGTVEEYYLHCARNAFEHFELFNRKDAEK